MFKVLPCPACSYHAIKYEKENPVIVSSGQDLFEWLVTLHNDINKRTGKKSDWTQKEAKDAIIKRYFSDARELSRAQKIRLEDHQMLIRLKVENRILRKKLNLPEHTENNDISESLQSIIDAGAAANQKSNGESLSDTSDLNDETNNTLAIVNIVLGVSTIILLIAITSSVFKKNKTS
jgi:hypothetical protein